MDIKKQAINPKIAQVLLEANTKNRRVRPRVVLRYANEMSAGRWKEDTGEMIIISKEGTILNGQHRLLAIIKSGATVKFHIATGVDEDRFDIMDSGAPRSAADAFGIDGIHYSNVIPSMMVSYLYLKEGKPGKIKDASPSTPQLLELYHKDPTFWQSVASKSLTWYAAFSKILAPSIIGGLYAMLYELNESQAENFMSQLCTGLQVQNESIAIMRQKLINDRLALKKLPRTYRLAMIIKTWNYYMTGEVVKIIKWDTEREEFPVPIGRKKKQTA